MGDGVAEGSGEVLVDTEEVGVVSLPVFRGAIMVLSNTWPSVYLTLMGLGVKDLSVTLVGEAVGCLHGIILKLYPNARVRLEDSWYKATQGVLLGNHSIACVLVQYGDWEPELASSVEAIQGINHGLIGRVKGRNKNGSSGVYLSHARCGGATLGRYKLEYDKLNVDSLMLMMEKGNVSRFLEHYFKPMEKGITIGTPEKAPLRKRKRDDTPVYYGKNRIPTGTLDFDVVAPSVYSSSGFVKRRLTPGEITEIYDLQSDSCKLIKNLEDATLQRYILSLIVNSVPEKVARRMLIAIAASLEGTAPRNECKKNDLSELKGVQWLEEEDEEINDEKAARNDDIEPDVSQWDKYILEHFDQVADYEVLVKKGIITSSPSISSRAPMICKGGQLEDKHINLFEKLRERLLRLNKRKLTSSFRQYLTLTYGVGWPSLLSKEVRSKLAKHRGKKKLYIHGQSSNTIKELHKDVANGIDAITRYADSTWWDWTAGSSLHFWRWHPEFIKEARDGTTIHMMEAFEPYWGKPNWPKDAFYVEKMKEKLCKVIDRGYISKGVVVSTTTYFHVPKGESDIRMVYDATKCGLNDILWCPTFLLPDIDTVLRQVPIGGFMGDIDLGEMFLNFPLDPKIRKYVGVDVTALRKELIELGIIDASYTFPTDDKALKPIILCWVRCLMGLKPSPYNACKAFAWASEFIRGDISDETNPFHYNKVVLNLPGSKTYDPSFPLIYKFSTKSNSLAGNFGVYIDDIRLCHPYFRGCVQVARQIASRANYLGIQDAPRKRRFPSQTPSVWSGAKSISTDEGLYTATTQAKWDKAKAYIKKWINDSTDSGVIRHKELEQGRGFLIHLGRTYPMFVPHFKGIHHLIESWRIGRNHDGWKLGNDEWKSLLVELEYAQASDIMERGSQWQSIKKKVKKKADKEGPPEFLETGKVKRFLLDLKALDELMSSVKPPRRLVRGRSLLLVRYGFGDASGTGFGASTEFNGVLRYRYGTWGDDTRNRSSNYRELSNLVITLEKEGNEGLLAGVEMYMFTDNSTAENCYYKGSSSSEKLHELVFRLRKLETNFGCKIIICHVAGTRMIRQGTDGLSRGNLSEGVMRGDPMSLFVPLHQTALEREPKLMDWIKSWTRENELEILSPIDWFSRGHDFDGYIENVDGYKMPKLKSGCYLWAPAPASAEVALEEIRTARHKRTDSTFLFICPRLLTPVWRQHLHKSADVVCEIPARFDYWNEDMHEPLTIAFYFPFINHRPWQLKGSPAMLGVEECLSKMWKSGDESTGIILRKLWFQARSLRDMQASVVFKMLRQRFSFTIPYRRCDNGCWCRVEEKEG